MKERSVDACQELLRWYEADGEAFLQRIVTGMRVGYTSTSQNESEKKHGVAPQLVSKTEEGAGATICRQSHVDFLLGLQQADLNALHAQRKHCDQCHRL